MLRIRGWVHGIGLECRARRAELWMPGRHHQVIIRNFQESLGASEPGALWSGPLSLKLRWAFIVWPRLALYLWLFSLFCHSQGRDYRLVPPGQKWLWPWTPFLYAYFPVKLLMFAAWLLWDSKKNRNPGETALAPGPWCVSRNLVASWVQGCHFVFWPFSSYLVWWED